MNTKQTLGNNIFDKTDHKHNPHSMCGPIKNHQHNKQKHLLWKTAITDMDKAKPFNKQFTNITPYSTNLINRHIDHTIKTLPTKEIQLTTTQVQLAISNSTNNNSTGPNGINIRHLKHLGPLTIRYLTNMYKIALNTNTIPHLLKQATIIPIPKQRPQHWHKLLTHITSITHCQNTENTVTIHNRKHSNHISSTWIQT